MTQYDENLNTLAKVYPQMDILIEEAKKRLDTGIYIIEEKAFNGEPILKVGKGNQVCYLNGKRETHEAAEIWGKMMKSLPTNTPVFLMGVGNPNYLKELAENAKNKLIIAVYEPSLSIFVKFLELVPLREWMERHLLIFWVDGLEGMDGKAMATMLKRILWYEKLPYAK